MAWNMDTLGVGHQLPTQEFEAISRTTLALYAGASGDHNPLHIDIDFARAAGFDDVFAHGSLVMAYLGRFLAQGAGYGRLRRFGVRFTGKTNVHDAIICSGSLAERIASEGEPLIRLELSAHTRDGKRVMTGEAVISAK